MIESAAQLFAERGYIATSIDDIAVAAGVSRATVFTSVGGKPLLLKTAFDIAIVGNDEPVALPDTQRARVVHQATDAHRYLALYAELVTEIGGRLGRIYEAVRVAAKTDADVSRVWEAHQSQRRQGAANVVHGVQSRGNLREGLDSETAADIVWVLNDPGMYHLLVHGRGWKPSRFQTWLARTMQEQLLGSSPSTPN